MVRELTSLRPAPGFDRVFYPGLIEAECREKRRTEGIPIDQGLYRELVQLDGVGPFIYTHFGFDNSMSLT